MPLRTTPPTLWLAAIVLLAITPIGTQVRAQEDRGQPVSPDKALKLGPDVTRTVGLPAGPPVTGEELHRQTEELTARMRCPVCQGHAIVDSPAEAARNMKTQVRAMIAAGFSEDQILRYFEAAYGEFIRLMPRATGFNLLVWLIPLAGALIGLVGILLAYRRRSSKRATGAPSETPADAPSKTEDSATATESAARTAATPASATPKENDDLGDWLAKVREEVGRRDD